MEPMDATTWIAALGIAGTLLGALGGAMIQGAFLRRQVRDQERVSVRNALRGERRLAYAAVLDHYDAFKSSLSEVIAARVKPEWDDNVPHPELWSPLNDSLAALKRSVTSVAITGPTRMAELSEAIYAAALAQADSMRGTGTPFMERTRQFAEASDAHELAHGCFIEAARAILGAGSPLAEVEPGDG
jgi:hypothetical protein